MGEPGVEPEVSLKKKQIIENTFKLIRHRSDVSPFLSLTLVKALHPHGLGAYVSFKSIKQVYEL